MVIAITKFKLPEATLIEPLQGVGFDFKTAQLALSALDQHLVVPKMSRFGLVDANMFSRKIRKEHKWIEEHGENPRKISSVRSSKNRPTRPTLLNKMLIRKVRNSRLLSNADRRKNKESFINKIYNRSYHNSQRRLRNEILSTRRRRYWARV